jgi:hypothetical protein
MELPAFVDLVRDSAIAEYSEKYRRGDYGSLRVSEPFDIRPELGTPKEHSIGGTWTQKWPFDEDCGVYLLYSASFELLYVGKSSMNRCLGKRLYDRFGGGEVCKPSEDWLEEARFVINIAVPREMPFEAPALEEFLIRKLQPRLNGPGK